MTEPHTPPTPATDRFHPQPMAATTRIWLIALLGWTAFLCFYDLSGGARFEPIDCWVSQTAREMRDADDWLVPRFSSETRMQKSPGPYWAVMIASLLRATPVDEVSARLPNAVGALALVGIIFWLTRRVAGDRAAVFAGFAASSSVLVLWWSHRAASDLGLTTWTTLSLAALWVACDSEPPGRKRNALFLLGYFAAGMGMLWKMPMPLPVVGLPAFLYVLVRNRWRVLASPIHLWGLLLFLLPWLPWAIAVSFVEDAALLKWKVEFIDRFTGQLPNVEGQDKPRFLLTYLGPTLLYTLPFTLSLPLAFVRPFRQKGVRRDGALFMALWFTGLLVFFTASVGKEWRYFLPALPPLLVLLGIELAAFFDPNRPRTPALDRLGLIGVWLGVPAVLLGGGIYGLTRWWQQRGQYELEGLYEYGDVMRAFAVTAAILVVGCGLAAWLYTRRREHASFGTLVGTMYLMWLWTWPHLMPLVMSQRPFVDFATQLADARRIPPGYRAHLRQIGSQDSRIIWYSDVRFPRLIDQLDLLLEQDGRRDLQYEMRRYGEEMVDELAADDPILMVASLPDYLEFVNEAPPMLAAEGRPLPPLHLWIQTRYGTEDRHYVVFGNKPPRFPESDLHLRPEVLERLQAKGRTYAWPTTWPATQPAATGTTAPASRPAADE